MTHVAHARLVAVVGVACLAAVASSSLVVQAQAPDFPAACRTDNPYLVSVCYSVPVRLPSANMSRVIVVFNDTPDDSPQYTLATSGEIGSIWGLAYRHADRSVYAAAFHKRYVDYGPGGPGVIYRVPIDGARAGPGLPSAGVTVAITVPNVAPSKHSGDFPGFDSEARDWAGKTGLADIDLNAEEDELFVVNLDDRKIYRFSMPDGTLLGSFDHGAAGEEWVDDARPFGLKVHQGRVYHGVVNSAESTQDRDDLSAYVYSSLPDGSGMRLETMFHLDYPRGLARVPGLIGYKPIEEVPIDWLPWKDGYNRLAAERAGQAVYPQPMLSDIEFAANGDMVLGLKDRQGDMTMSEQVIWTDTGRIEKPGLAIGDVVPALLSGSVYEVWPEDLSHTDPPADRTEYYEDPTSLADESAVGGLAQLWEHDIVASVAITERETGSRLIQGMSVWYEEPSASPRRDRIRREHIVCGQYSSPVDPPFAGLLSPQHNEWRPIAELGDLEVICGVEPEETPTPTASNTPTPTPTVTGTPPPTITPTPTNTPEPFRIFLPIALKFELCVAHADVVLVLDMSSSMERETGTGRKKYEAAVNAARNFAGLLDLTGTQPGQHDQLAVAGFNDRGWIQVGLTNDLGRIRRALERLPDEIREGTRLDLAFETGQEAFSGPNRKLENAAVMIVLTDGIPNRVPFPPGSNQETVVLAAATRAKDQGTRVFTIGVGLPEDIIEWLLQDCATDPPEDHYYYAPSPDDLSDIYGRIARLLPCPGVEPWPPRSAETERFIPWEVTR